jgi:hypothetical protein
MPDGYLKRKWRSCYRQLEIARAFGAPPVDRHLTTSSRRPTMRRWLPCPPWCRCRRNALRRQLRPIEPRAVVANHRQFIAAAKAAGGEP